MKFRLLHDRVGIRRVDANPIAILLITTEAMVADIPHEVRRQSPHQRHGRNELQCLKGLVEDDRA
ncbi:hypothetical protein ATN84_16280 [Paramesorhizobium deserti]|uniref:Uncharacterized protein n=1 Tax=Paramesorhizobium deserti TaxID=1494590 RepID=A0A135HTA4_9HYPH|nr:hypothetical protein [Paramesorhizobium deserti]KXF76426.1 hypothetical protein ATN84_16280 [Paramesorhizobium deserti]